MCPELKSYTGSWKKLGTTIEILPKIIENLNEL
jgi:hypothetical protein